MAKGQRKKKPKDDEQTEPLSTFQETNKTGRGTPELSDTSIPVSATDKKKALAERAKEKGITASNGSRTILSIHKVKLVKKKSLKINFSTLASDGSTTEIEENHKSNIHPNCRAAFQGLAIHFALMCDYISTQQVKDINAYRQDLVEKFTVTGVSVGGGEGEEGIVISGQKINKQGKAVILNTPFTRFEEAEESRYRYMDDLQVKLNALMECVKKYRTGEELGEPDQPELEFGDGGEDNSVPGEDHDFEHEEDK